MNRNAHSWARGVRCWMAPNGSFVLAHSQYPTLDWSSSLWSMATFRQESGRLFQSIPGSSSSYWQELMAKPGAIPIERPSAESEHNAAIPATLPAGNCRPGDDELVAMFNRVRDELVSTLMYLLGKSDDAQDVAQE